jgi:FkbM family methyltransferase
VYLRNGTFDESIRLSVLTDYPATPRAFTAGQIVVDVGCHIGAFCAVAASRGATVIGYEANRENYGLACINAAALNRVSIRHAAVWRSDRAPGTAVFVPSIDPTNTGGGSVLFTSKRDLQVLFERRGEAALYGVAEHDMSLPTSHPVPTIGLDAVLEALGEVRLLKIDAEGAEYPVLLTATRLRQIDTIVGEYHEFTDAEMEMLAPEARVGTRTYTAAMLRDALADVGFAMDIASGTQATPRGLFTAVRR